uniref:Uncharacterized protein n=1 Tax=Schizaphis graminum TaxID=13262 RepID=A0A2S2NU31_SCHGA
MNHNSDFESGAPSDPECSQQFKPTQTPANSLETTDTPPATRIASAQCGPPSENVPSALADACPHQSLPRTYCILFRGKISNLMIKSFIGTWDVLFFRDAPVCTKTSHNSRPVATPEVARTNASSKAHPSIFPETATAPEPCTPTSLVCLQTGVCNVDMVVVYTDDDERLLSVEFNVSANVVNESNNSIASRWHNNIGHVANVSWPIVINEFIRNSLYDVLTFSLRFINSFENSGTNG